MELSDLRTRPNALAAHYSRFRVSDRLLLTGHSHQAWPDVAEKGMQDAWRDAADLVDQKWDEAFARADRVRRGYARLLGEGDGGAGRIALGDSTHTLLVRLLSALPLRRRPVLVTTEGEFFTIRRQMDRLEEEGLRIVRVPLRPHEDIAERLAAAVDDRCSLVMVSSVLFESARIVRGIDRVMSACRKKGAELLVDAYHHLGVLPFSTAGLGLEDAFIVGGGYKYCQLGEGNAFLRFPEGREFRPVVTGWFAEFSTLSRSRGTERLSYEKGPGRFAGATYDPVSHYRASEVFDFFLRNDLRAGFLRRVSRHQIGLLARAFDDLDLDPRLVRRDRDTPLEEIAGFLVLRSPRASEISDRLRERGVLTDSRGEALRLGPAPYLDDEQLREGIRLLGEVATGLR